MRSGRLIPALMVALVGCAGQSPESELERLVGDAERAGEARQTGFFRDVIADSYVDARGNDREQMINLIRGYFLANQSIDVFTRVENIELSGTDAAEVVVLAGLLARRPDQGLAGFDGRLYRIDLELVDNGGGWQVIGARWERSLQALRGD